MDGQGGVAVAALARRLSTLAGGPAQPRKRWIKAGVFEAMVHDLRMIVRWLHERAEQPTAAILDGRPLQSSPESGGRAGCDGYQRKKGRKVHVAVDTLGNLLALVVTPANAQERAQVAALAEQVQELTGQSVALAYVDQGYTGKKATEAAAHGIQWEVVKLADAKRGFMLLPRRWVVERSFAWLARFRRLSRDNERLPTTLAGLHWPFDGGSLASERKRQHQQRDGHDP